MAASDIVQVPRLCKQRITKFFAGITPRKKQQYIDDWSQLTPRSNHSKLNRWRFAYCTVHTPWLRSCEQYDLIKNKNKTSTYDTLVQLLKQTSGGMFTIKATGINHLQELWSKDPSMFEPTSDWQSWRDNLASKLKKLGMAKTSFAIEMLHPLNANLICIDRHMFKAFGWHRVDDSASVKQYRYYEDYWLDMSAAFNVSPVIARNIFWDKIQKQPNSLYWAKYL
jgi:thermostable 8-oxoguanine DNA glycosylase